MAQMPNKRHNGVTPEMQRKIDQITCIRLDRLRMQLNAIPLRLPPASTVFSDIAAKLDPSAFDGMTGLNHLDMPTRFPFRFGSTAAEAAMVAYINR